MHQDKAEYFPTPTNQLEATGAFRKLLYRFAAIKKNPEQVILLK